MDGLPFIKMHGLGNDFVVLDTRQAAVPVDAHLVRQIAARRTGVGCDQLIALEESEQADAFMRIWNADGSEVAACGNATRCVAALLMAGVRRNEVTIETLAGLLTAQSAADGLVMVDMGEPLLGWRQIPLAREMDTLHIDYRHPSGLVADPVGVNMGNPHAVFFVEDAEAVPISVLGPEIENDPLFPERVNVSFVSRKADGSLRVCVWERGAGRTLACGTAACAVIVAATRRGLVDRVATIEMDGGQLAMEWRADGHVIMTGPVAVSFSGVIALPSRRASAA